VQEVAPCGAHKPAAQGEQEGAAAQPQLLSVADLRRKGTATVPADPATHENWCSEAPRYGAVSCTRFAPGKEAAEG